MLLSVTLAFAGCVGDAPDTAPNELAGGSEVLIDPETGREQVVRRTSVSFGDAPPILVELETSGRFEVQQHHDPGGDVQQAAGLDRGSHHRHDISGHVPVGVPTRIVMEVEADLEQGDLDLWLDMPGDEIWTSEADAPLGGYSWFAFHVVRSGQDDVAVVVRYDDLEAAQDFEYTLRISVESDPNFLLAGIPVAVPVPRGAFTMELAFPGDTPGRVWLWGPDDRSIQTVPPAQGRWNVTLSSAGDHVIMLPEGSGAANVSILVPFEGEEVRPLHFGILGQDITQTEPVGFDANSPVETKVEVVGVPIQMGIQIDIERITKDVHATLEGPEGELIDVSFTDDVPFHTVTPDGQFSFTIMTYLGKEGLAEGSYIATFQGNPNGPGSLSLWVVRYARV